MTKLARVILIFVIIFSSLFSLTRQVSAENQLALMEQPAAVNETSIQDNNFFDNLIKLILDKIKLLNSSFNHLKPEPTLEPPSVSFGRLLTPTVTDTYSDEKQASYSATLVEKLLAQDDSDAAQRLKEFYQKATASGQIGQRLQIDTLSNLVAAINEIKTTPTPTFHPQLEQILVQTNTQPQNNIGAMTQNPRKTHYVIAILGDSMVDTLGKDLPHLKQLLVSAYPDCSFVLINYGQGGTDIESGLYRLTNPTKYLDKDFPPLLSQNIDILIVESFAYNHWSGQFYDLDRQWLAIARIIEKVKIKSPNTKIILSATISPNSRTFGDGKLNWPTQLKWNSAIITKGYLQNIINFATSEHYPLADAYHPSLDETGEGQEKYINQSDHLHPSDEGALLFSQKILETIKENKMIE